MGDARVIEAGRKALASSLVLAGVLVLAPGAHIDAAVATETVARSQPFPSSGRVRFVVTAGPGLEIGRAEHTWRIEGRHYVLRSALETTGLAALLRPERLLQQSEGVFGARGFVPQRLRVTRNGQAAERADFDWTRGIVRLEHRGRVSEVAVARGAQDVLSVFYQVALFPPAGANFEADVATGKGTYRRVFRAIGERRIALPVGELRALDVRAQQDDGERIDVWLAADRDYLPVRIRMVDRKGNVIEQQAIEIDTGAADAAAGT